LALLTQDRIVYGAQDLWLSVIPAARVKRAGTAGIQKDSGFAADIKDGRVAERPSA